MSKGPGGEMHRPTVGVLAIVVLLLGAILSLVGVGDEAQAWGAGLVRVGLALGALWLALPELKRLPRWVLVAAAVLLVVLARFPKQFFVAIVVAVAFAILRPRVRAAQRRDAR
jgi:hypothetical protein